MQANPTKKPLVIKPECLIYLEKKHLERHKVVVPDTLLSKGSQQDHQRVRL